MKEITAIIQPHMLSRVLNGLYGLSSFLGITVYETARGQGTGMGKGGSFEPTEENFTLKECAVLQIFCEDSAADEIEIAIAQSARTGLRGDGIIAVRDVTKIVRIRDGKNSGKER